jgi:hypothetical protein
MVWGRGIEPPTVLPVYETSGFKPRYLRGSTHPNRAHNTARFTLHLERDACFHRADAGFANPEIYEYLEAEGIKYAIRLPGADRIFAQTPRWTPLE